MTKILKYVVYFVALSLSIADVWIFGEWILHYLSASYPKELPVVTPVEMFINTMILAMLWTLYKILKEDYDNI